MQLHDSSAQDPNTEIVVALSRVALRLRAVAEPEAIGPYGSFRRAEAKELLAARFDLSTREQVLGALASCLRGSVVRSWLPFAATVMGRELPRDPMQLVPPAVTARLDDAGRELFARRLRLAAAQGDRVKTIFAFELGEAALLVRLGYSAGLLRLEDAKVLFDLVGQLTKRSFDMWPRFVDSFVAGCEFVAGKELPIAREQAEQMLDPRAQGAIATVPFRFQPSVARREAQVESASYLRASGGVAPQLSPMRRLGLALDAILAEHNRESHDWLRFAPPGHDMRDRQRILMERDWKIFDREGAMRNFAWLLEGGFSAQWRRHARWVRSSPSGGATLLDGIPPEVRNAMTAEERAKALRSMRIVEAYIGRHPDDVEGFDYGLMVRIARSCCTIGYFESEEAWALIELAAALALARFADFRTFGDSWVAGSDFLDGERSPIFRGCYNQMFATGSSTYRRIEWPPRS
jgi:hypothetical protein